MLKKMLVASAAMFSVPAFASTPPTVDTAALVTTIEGSLTPIGAVGLAVLGVLAGILVYKLIRRVM